MSHWAKYSLQITNILDGMARDNWLQEQDSAAVWTTEIKHSLCICGESNGFWTAASGFRGRSEWLFDVIWLSYSPPDSENMKSVPLVAECEWGADMDILWDFQKLLVARAGIRVMIFGDRNTVNDTTARLLYSHALEFDGNDNDFFLLAGFESFELGWNLYRFQIGSNKMEKCPAVSSSEPRREESDWINFSTNK